VKIVAVVGARPNFMKIAPILAELRDYPQATTALVHTGQHYDTQMSDAFFAHLEIPRPDVNLGVRSLGTVTQIAEIMTRLEPVLATERPDVVVVVGDVNSTVAAALTAVKLCLPVAHVEAGLRSFDRTMPEEINRLLTDQIADLLFTPSQDADENLRAEGIPEQRIRFVGNIMIDSLFKHLARAAESTIREELGVGASRYAVLTLHRPSNVDECKTFERILEALEEIGQRIPVIFPVHPRTRKTIAEFGFAGRIERAKGLRLIEPLGYLDFLNLYSGARLVLTDSGGIQEETTVLGIPCLTLRENTERPITVEMGTNTIVGRDPEKIKTAAFAALDGSKNSSQRVPPLWDGHTAERILDALT